MFYQWLDHKGSVSFCTCCVGILSHYVNPPVLSCAGRRSGKPSGASPEQLQQNKSRAVQAAPAPRGFDLLSRATLTQHSYARDHCPQQERQQEAELEKTQEKSFTIQGDSNVEREFLLVSRYLSVIKWSCGLKLFVRLTASRWRYLI